MARDDLGSVTCWIDHLKRGDRDAAGPLWGRYFGRMVRLARAKLRAARPGAVEDEEDAALSAFHSLCTGAADGRFPHLADRDDLWRLLIVITARKAFDQVERRGRQKRGGGRVVGEAALDDADGRGLDHVPGAAPGPELEAILAEEAARLMEALGDDTLRRVAAWKVEGRTNAEIRDALGCSLRTVSNKLELIRKVWTRESS